MRVTRLGRQAPEARTSRFADVLTANDLVISVCDNAHEELGGLAQVHWSVPDPVRAGSDAAFDAAFDELASRIGSIAPHLTAAP